MVIATEFHAPQPVGRTAPTRTGQGILPHYPAVLIVARTLDLKQFGRRARMLYNPPPFDSARGFDRVLTRVPSTGRRFRSVKGSVRRAAPGKNPNGE